MAQTTNPETLDRFPLLKAILPVNKYKHIVLYDGREKYLQVNIFTEAEARDWMTAFAESSGCMWYAVTSLSNGPNFAYRTVMKCTHVTRKQKREFDCPAKYCLTVSNETPSTSSAEAGSGQSTMKKDSFDNQFPTAIKMVLNHNHSVTKDPEESEKQSEEIQTRLGEETSSSGDNETNLAHNPEEEEKPGACIDVKEFQENYTSTIICSKKKEETEEKLIELFQRGHTPWTAFEILKHDIQLQEGINYMKALKEGGFQDLRDCYKLFTELDMPENTPTPRKLREDLGILVNEYNALHGETCAAFSMTSRGALVFAICSPLMRRVHAQLQHCDEVCFFDTRNDGILTTCRPFFILGHSVAGGLPLGVIVTDKVDEHSVYEALELLKTVLPCYAFGGRHLLGPRVFLTRITVLDQRALKRAFPSSVPKTCVFHIVQYAWQWIIKKTASTDLQEIQLLNFLKEIVVIETEREMKAKIDTLLRNPLVRKFTTFKQLLQNQIYNQRELWMPGAWDDLDIKLKSYHSKNFFTLAIPVLKDRIMYQGGKFSPPRLFHFFMTRLDNYYEHRMTGIISKKPAVQAVKYMPIETTISWKIKNVEKDYYVIATGKGVYDIDASACVCTCDIGSSGGPCMHQGCVITLYNLLPFDLKNNLDVQKSIDYIAKGGKTLPEYKLASHSSFIPDGMVRNDPKDIAIAESQLRQRVVEANSQEKDVEMKENTEKMDGSEETDPKGISKPRQVISDSLPGTVENTEQSNNRSKSSSTVNKACVPERGKIRKLEREEPYVIKVRKVSLTTQNAESPESTTRMSEGLGHEDKKIKGLENKKIETLGTQQNSAKNTTDDESLESDSCQERVSQQVVIKDQSVNKRDSIFILPKSVDSQESEPLKIRIHSIKSLKEPLPKNTQDQDVIPQLTRKSSKEVIAAFMEMCNTIVKMAHMNENLLVPALDEFVKCMKKITTESLLVSVIDFFVKTAESTLQKQQKQEGEIKTSSEQLSPQLMMQPLQLILPPQQSPDNPTAQQPMLVSQQSNQILQPGFILQPQQSQQPLILQPVQPVLQSQDTQAILQSQQPEQQLMLQMQQPQQKTAPQLYQPLQQQQQHIRMPIQQQQQIRMPIQQQQHTIIPLQQLEQVQKQMTMPLQQQQQLQQNVRMPQQQQNAGFSAQYQHQKMAPSQSSQSQSQQVMKHYQYQGMGNHQPHESIQQNLMDKSTSNLMDTTSGLPVFGSTHIYINGTSKGKGKMLPAMNITYTCQIEAQTPHECLLLVPTSVAIKKGIHEEEYGADRNARVVDVPFDTIKKYDGRETTKDICQLCKKKMTKADVGESEGDHEGDTDPLHVQVIEQGEASAIHSKLSPEVLIGSSWEHEVETNAPEVFTC